MSLSQISVVKYRKDYYRSVVGFRIIFLKLWRDLARPTFTVNKIARLTNSAINDTGKRLDDNIS